MGEVIHFVSVRGDIADFPHRCCLSSLNFADLEKYNASVNGIRICLANLFLMVPTSPPQLRRSVFFVRIAASATATTTATTTTATATSTTATGSLLLLLLLVLVALPRLLPTTAGTTGTGSSSSTTTDYITTTTTSTSTTTNYLLAIGLTTILCFESSFDDIEK